MAKRSPHITLQDVARLAGVSIKTVSRVANNQGEISEPTRQRVQAAIDQLGYRPNILARSLVNQRTDTLAVVAWGIDYYGPSRTLLGIEHQANEFGYSLVLNLLGQPDIADVSPVLDGLAARRVDGIVWAVPEVGNNRAWIRPDLLEQLPPIVFLSMAPRPGLAIIAVDNRAGGVLATEHLIQQGRRVVGVITGPMAWWEARERHAGWEQALTQTGLKPEPSLCIQGDWSAASGARGMERLLAQQPDLDAVFVCNDQMALGALGAAQRLGRQVPKDLAVVGFDNTPESAYFQPPLTTVYQRLVEAGRSAVRTLHQIVQAQRKDDDSMQPAATAPPSELVIRESSLPTARGD